MLCWCLSACHGSHVCHGSIFGSLEQLLERSFGGSRPGQRDDWQEVEGNWVLRPPGVCVGGGDLQWIEQAIPEYQCACMHGGLYVLSSTCLYVLSE